MVNPARPTDEDAERARGRVALWLDGVAIAKSATAQSDTSEVQRDRVLENERLCSASAVRHVAAITVAPHLGR